MMTKDWRLHFYRRSFRLSTYDYWYL